MEVRGYKPSYSTQLLLFSYNGLHQKIKKTQYMDNGKYYYYGLDNRVLEERDATNGSVKFAYVWGSQYIDELVARRSVSTGYWEYYFHDSNFNVVTRIVTSPYGTSRSRYIYTAYGKPTQLSSDWNTISTITEDLYLFTGREYHQITGIYDYRRRLLDPDLGRFLQRDPIGIWEDVANFGNAYQYAAGNPVNLVDPFGLAVTTCNECDNQDPAKCKCTIYFRLCVRVDAKNDKTKGQMAKPEKVAAYVARAQTACNNWKREIEKGNATRKCKVYLDCKVVAANPPTAETCREEETEKTVDCKGEKLPLIWNRATFRPANEVVRSHVEGGRTGTWDDADDEITLNHEEGHMLGLPDDYKEVKNKAGKVTGKVHAKRIPGRWSLSKKGEKMPKEQSKWQEGIMGNSKTGKIGKPETDRITDKECKADGK